MRVCPHCGKETRAVDRYCLHCGQRIDSEPRGNTPPLFVTAGESGWALASARMGANGAGSSKAAPSNPANPASSPPSSSAAPEGAASDDPLPPGDEPAATGQATAKARLALQPRPGTEERAREFALDGSELTIGRAPNCQIVLADDQLASRRHAALRFDGERYTIADLGSSNGTYVNGAEIKGSTPVRLNEGDRITVGEHELLYTTAPVPEEAVRPIELTTNGLPVPVPTRWPPSAPAGDTDLRLPAVSAANQAQPAPAASVPEATPAMSPPPGAGAITAIEQLHTQLVEASAALARRVETAERETERLRSALAALETRAGEALTALGGEEAGSASLDELIQVASQTAENPRHLDYVMALAERAGDVARALESERGLARALEELRDRIAGLAEQSDE